MDCGFGGTFVFLRVIHVQRLKRLWRSVGGREAKARVATSE
jgi:hypothetical protein